MKSYDNWRVTHSEDCTYIEAPRELDAEFDDLDLRVAGNFMPEDRKRVAEVIANRLNGTNDDQRIKELEAHVERLREALSDIIGTSAQSHEDALDMKDIAADALDETPAQSLREIQADAIQALLKSDLVEFGGVLQFDDVHDYEQQLRNGDLNNVHI